MHEFALSNVTIFVWAQDCKAAVAGIRAQVAGFAAPLPGGALAAAALLSCKPAIARVSTLSIPESVEAVTLTHIFAIPAAIQQDEAGGTRTSKAADGVGTTSVATHASFIALVDIYAFRSSPGDFVPLVTNTLEGPWQVIAPAVLTNARNFLALVSIYAVLPVSADLVSGLTVAGKTSISVAAATVLAKSMILVALVDVKTVSVVSQAESWVAPTVVCSHAV